MCQRFGISTRNRALSFHIDIPDLLDRAAIAHVKVVKTGEDCVKVEWEERGKHIDELATSHPRWPIKTWLEKLYRLHSQIWQFEGPLRRAKPLELKNLEQLRSKLEFTDEEIRAAGIASLHVRQINRQRITLRNAIVETTGCGYSDIKANEAAGK